MMMMKTMSMKRRPYGYTKMEKEDPEETSHRRAQFLIYKVLEKADRRESRRRPCFMIRIKMCKLKIKIINNRSFTRINNTILSATLRIHAQIRALKRLMFGSSSQNLISLPDITFLAS